MKATWAKIGGVGKSLFKDPVTDSGTKRSARGRVAVLRSADNDLFLVNDATPEMEAASLLRPIWEDGRFLITHTFKEIASRLGVRQILPG